MIFIILFVYDTLDFIKSIEHILKLRQFENTKITKIEALNKIKDKIQKKNTIDKEKKKKQNKISTIRHEC
jgi:hypothetical protein